MTAPVREPSFFETVNLYFERAAALTEYPRGLLDQIKACNSVCAFQFPVRTRRGYEVISGWRAQLQRSSETASWKAPHAARPVMTRPIAIRL